MLILSSLALAALPQILTVTDSGAPGTFSSLQDAVDAAVDGDTILVDLPSAQSGRLAGASVYDKSLLIHGVTPGPEGSVPEIGVPIGPLRIVGLSEGKTLTLRALDVSAGPLAGSGPASAVGIESCAGTVRAERCHFNAPDDFPHGPTVALDLALDVTLVDTIVTGSVVAGIRARRSRLSAIDTVVHAGQPGIVVDTGSGSAFGIDGPPALALETRSFAWLGDCQIEGGDGGGAYCAYVHAGCYTEGGDGGVGVVTEPGSLCFSLGSTILGGRPGHPEWDSYNWGAYGAPVVGLVSEVPGAQRRLEVPEVVASGSAIEARFDGLPGEEVWILGGRAGGHRFLGWQWGILQVNAPYDLPLTLLGTVPESGSLRASFHLPTVSSGGAQTTSVQAFFRSAPTRYRLSEVQDITVLAPGTPELERQSTLFVNAAAPPGGDGSSWNTAYPSLEAALDDPAGTQVDTRFTPDIWMAQGTYIHEERLSVSKSMAVYGGFQGTESSREDRNPVLYPTWIDGDVDQNDHLGITTDNSVGLLDIRGGYHTPTSISLDSVGFRNSSWTAVHCLFARLSVSACRFEDNHAAADIPGDYPGALACFISDPSYLTYRAVLMGLTVRRSLFYGNSGQAAGALAVYPPAAYDPFTPLPHAWFHCADSVFSGNFAEGIDTAGSRYGGAITVWKSSDPIPFQVSLIGNTFFENERPPTGNTPLQLGGVHVQPEHSVKFVNNICWSSVGGAASFVTLLGGSDDSVHHNCLHTIPAPLASEPTNFTASPMFRDTRGPDGMAGTGDEDLRPALDSPCIDAGHMPSLMPSSEWDALGLPRVVDRPEAPGAGVDLGAFEVQ